MARIFMDGFETGRPDGQTPTFGYYQGSIWQYDMTAYLSRSILRVVDSGAKTGTYALYAQQNSGISYRHTLFKNLGSNIVEHYGRVECDVNLQEDGVVPIVCFRDDTYATAGDTNSIVATIRVSRTADLVNLHLYVGAVEVASSSEAFINDGGYVRIEWRLLVDDTNGVFEVKVNGNSVISFQGDTDPTIEGHIRFLCLGKPYAGSTNYIARFDDVAINDTTGTVNNSWVGRGYIYLAKPKGIGNYSQWTPSNETYDNWEMVNTVPDDGDTTYVESETPGHRDSYQMETIEDALGVAIGDGVIKAVQHVFKGRYEDAHAAVEPFVRIGATDYDLDPATDMQNAYYRYWDRVLNVNPATSAAWTQEAFDGMEAGVKFDDSE